MQPGSQAVQDEPAATPQASSRPPGLHLGPQRRSGQDEVVLHVEFWPPAAGEVSRIRAEVEVGEGPWRFRKAEAPRGTALRVSTRQRHAERSLPAGEKQRITVVSLVITTSARVPIPSGPVATLTFSLSHPDTALIPVILREWEATPLDPAARRQPPAMEPPAAEPPPNPAASCFFFTH